MGDQADAARPEPAALGGARDLLAELLGEGAVHGRDVDADLLEQAPAHHRHHAAAAVRAILRGTAPFRPFEAPGRALAERPRELVFELLEFRADAVAQFGEPRGGAGFQLIAR